MEGDGRERERERNDSFKHKTVTWRSKKERETKGGREGDGNIQS